MANTRIATLTQPRTDVYYERTGESEETEVIAATATATAVPGPDTPYIYTGEAETVRAYVDYEGTVTAINLECYVLGDTGWYWAGAADLTPEHGDEFRDWPLIGKFVRIAFRVASIEGGGTAAVRVTGVW